ncbi:protein kinase [Streptomyces sp. B1866]|uniref:protein kinase domain-containing protein n=1 Tax=Streptomyces sp. B1866 TaxID=3075431 RepID=UPI0028902B9A|nr:protein kinase [Streptomyces sp. B1866]MDT3399658.1 protein kinase [Streptomyces sp. B1866]
MAQTQRAQGPSDPDAMESGMNSRPETPDLSGPLDSWGGGGVVGDGRYRLTGRLGRGGMAEVFAAEDVRLGRTVAVKLLRADLAEDPVSKARFTREAQSVAGLNHHAVVAVYDSGEDVVGPPGGTRSVVPYIVMELVEGRTIRELLQSADAPHPEQALVIVSGVLEALAYSHQHGIVHRDIKPANVIITHAGAVKVMDFGIARALHGAASTMTQTGMVMGTPQYLSPEQALGKAVDHRSDLYATGCLLYELLALRPPFVGETPLSVVYQHVQDAPVPPSEISGGCPPELDGLVMRSLAKDPDDRFQSAEEMRGLVQYALRMLHEAGPHTGTWNTGPVTQHLGAATPAGGLPGTAALPHPAHGDTSQQPVLPLLGGRPGDGDGTGGYDGYDGGPGGGGHDGRRGRLWLVAVLAVLAVAVGVALALRFGGGDGGGENPSKPETSTSQRENETPSPTSAPTTADATLPGEPTGGTEDTPTLPTEPTPTDTVSASPTDPATDTPTEEPTDDGATPDDGEPTSQPSEDPNGGDPTPTAATDGGSAAGSTGG